jgi:hypothetical protein
VGSKKSLKKISSFFDNRANISSVLVQNLIKLQRVLLNVIMDKVISQIILSLLGSLASLKDEKM